MKSTWNKVYNYGKTSNKNKKRLTNDHGEFQQQSPQRLDDKHKHTGGRNDRWVMRFKLIQEEYYSIGKPKSLSS